MKLLKSWIFQTNQSMTGKIVLDRVLKRFQFEILVRFVNHHMTHLVSLDVRAWLIIENGRILISHFKSKLIVFFFWNVTIRNCCGPAHQEFSYWWNWLAPAISISRYISIPPVHISFRLHTSICLSLHLLFRFLHAVRLKLNAQQQKISQNKWTAQSNIYATCRY